MEKSDFVQLFSKLYNCALIPARCSTAFPQPGIFPYDPRVVKKDKVIKMLYHQQRHQQNNLSKNFQMS